MLDIIHAIAYNIIVGRGEKMAYKWRPSKIKAREFAQQMDEISDFCVKNNIIMSKSQDSYYFALNGKSYRVSNHTVIASNNAAYDDFGNQIRTKYHDKYDTEDIQIYASKTRLIEIYNNLKNGLELDKKGRIIKNANTI